MFQPPHSPYTPHPTTPFLRGWDGNVECQFPLKLWGYVMHSPFCYLSCITREITNRHHAMDSVFVLYLVTEVTCNGYFPVNKEQDQTLDFWSFTPWFLVRNIFHSLQSQFLFYLFELSNFTVVALTYKLTLDMW